MNRYLVTVTAPCTMLVEVEAGGALEADARAGAGHYEPATVGASGALAVARAKLEPEEDDPAEVDY